MSLIRCATRDGRIFCEAIRQPRYFMSPAGCGLLSTTLSTDTLTDRDRRKPRDPDATELSEWRRTALVIERFQPALRNGRLQEVVLRDGVLRLSPTGELMAVTTTDTPMVADIEVPSEPEIDLEEGLTRWLSSFGRTPVQT